jgi:hypothetical protein
VSIEPGSFIGGAFGDALSRTTALETITHDDYDRLFRTDLGAAYPTAPKRSYQPQAQQAAQTAQLSFAMPDGALPEPGGLHPRARARGGGGAHHPVRRPVAGR